MKRLLVANRGEIAVRIIRAARDLGLETVAVHSSADVDAMHVGLADAAVEIGPPQATKSYLNIDAILDAATSSRSDAVHPGYGFLAESPALAGRCKDAGLTFVGPAPETIERMGDKLAALAAARGAGVATIPGTDGPVAGDDEAAHAAQNVGYPLMIKAAAGGGGRGMRVVTCERELRAELAVARSEARTGFGDDRVYLERFIPNAKHVEVQVLGDGSRCIHLYDRECSLQRRRQKVVEEALSPSLGAETRDQITAAAVALANSVGYSSAGTVEFLYDRATEQFFFLEMNTRIQVEHPTTEMVCGVDLVTEQLRIAAGEHLRLDQGDVQPRGWAIEFRINAEDPANGFAPSPGTIERFDAPTGAWLRVDSGVRGGDAVPPFYDSLLAKLIVWGPDRATTVHRSRRVLSEFAVTGIATTLPMLRSLSDRPEFLEGDYHTQFLEQWIERSDHD